ncbi:MAG TPA: hypothetical protein DDW52_11440 [Planctomycetaceae bacterium]|nr:hypothetical protein [Planctomycetaceae bacterium]
MRFHSRSVNLGSRLVDERVLDYDAAFDFDSRQLILTRYQILFAVVRWTVRHTLCRNLENGRQDPCWREL